MVGMKHTEKGKKTLIREIQGYGNEDMSSGQGAACKHWSDMMELKLINDIQVWGGHRRGEIVRVDIIIG